MTEVLNEIKSRLLAKFPNFPTDVFISPGDSTSVCVRVFCVPEDQTVTVRDFIYNLQNEIGGPNGLILLALPKSIEITKALYPNFYREIKEKATTINHVWVIEAYTDFKWKPLAATLSRAKARRMKSTNDYKTRIRKYTSVEGIVDYCFSS